MLKLVCSGVDNGGALVDARLTIGRDPSNDVVLPDDGVSGFHAEIQVENGQWFLVDLGSTNGTFVNGKRITGKHAIKAWDKVRFDGVEAEVVDTEGRRPTMVNKALTDEDIAAASDKTQLHSAMGADKTQVVSVPGAKIVIVSGPASGKSFELAGESRTIGRGDGNDIVLSDQAVSSNHAALRKVAGAWRIDDVGSSNGVLVNGAKVSSRELKPGDKIVLGKTELRFEQPGMNGNKTQVISSVSGADTVTLQQPVPVKKPTPVWVYGLVAFLVVGLGAGAFFYFTGNSGAMLGKPKAVTAKLQGIPVWAQSLSGGRSGPGTPVLADINNDGFLDVILGDAKGFVTALDGQKGLKIFETETVDRILAPAATGDLTGDGVADVVVASRSGEVTALNGEGKILWKSSADLGLGAVVNRPVLVDVSADGVADVIVPTERKGLVALDGAHGWVLWDTATLFRGAVVTSPVVADVNGDGLKDFIAATDKGHVAAVTGQGKKAWQLWEGSVPAVAYASPLLVGFKDGGMAVIVATEADGLVALNAANGRGVWQNPKVGKCIASPVGVDANGDGVADAAAVAADGTVTMLSGSTGDEIWSQSLGADILASPAVFDCTNDGLGDLLVLDGTGNLNVVDMARGRVVLRVQVPESDSFVASPVLGDLTNDQMLEVVAAAKNGRISAFGLNRSLRKGTAPWAMFLGNDSHCAE